MNGAAGGRTRTALVTGGMGRVIGSKLAADGFDVAVAYAGDTDLAGATTGEIAGHGRHGAAFAADVADEEAVPALFGAVEDRFGRVAPGPAATAAFHDSTPAEEQQQLAALPPLGRPGSPDDIAGVVSFLVGPAGRWVNGQVVHANGGLA
jgi:NAD(P)-dependent dehydrogenase (short-subunit alcohol dehydrogenase family)